MAANLYLSIKAFITEKYRFRYNTITNELQQSVTGQEAWQAVKDANLQEMLYIEGYSDFDARLKALLKTDSVAIPYNPVKEYFEGLPTWDKHKDENHIKKLLSYLTLTDESEFSRAFFETQVTKWLVRTVACALRIDKVNKQCLTLIGKQNDGKTHFLRYLVPDALADLYTENVNIADKDGRRAICNNFLINFDELDSLGKHEITAIKSYMTKETEKQRRPYESREEVMQRIASFVASGNEKEVLTDHTGNVRWLIFDLENINHDNGGKKGYNSINIDDVYSQVMYYLNDADFKRQMTAEEIKLMDMRNSTMRKTTIESELLSKHLIPDFYPTEQNFTVTTMQTTEIMMGMMETYPHLKSLNVITLGRELTALKFERISQRNAYGVPTKYWRVKIVCPFRSPQLKDATEETEKETEPLPY